ncbi:hypothetical protein A8F94_22725 [Bacillus sp. FJAT-27225]|uniref:hypothetical protein n=1 Tax=Bacillus sp. FJAT-27225 TaxID=1743144 RepID=UPI00080C25E3|nr:hypothetical protein [Bacillus sp. FJAT-27225]OCA81675.1 hypothetical protein A8F94_22725 [Bacillus sp. FJAT-27225]
MFLPTNITIKGIKLNNTDHLSTVSFNSTIKHNRNVSAKKNQGFGQQHADGCLRIFVSTSINDNEPFDSFSGKATK